MVPVTFDFDLTVTLSVVLSLAAMVVAWYRTRRQNLDERLKIGSDRMDELDRRLAAAEQNISAAASKDDLHGMQLTLVGMDGKIDVISSNTEANRDMMRRFETVLTRHDNHLLESSRK